MQKRAHLIESLPFFHTLTADEAQRLIRGSVFQVFEKGSVVHRSDMPCRGAVILETGTLRAYIVSEEGREVTLFRIRAGESCVLSASCLLESIEFDIMIEASEYSEGVILPVGVLHPIMEQNPHVGMFIYKQATERFSDVMWAMQQILFMGADKRVAIFLWDESVARQTDTLTMTHEEIARNIGSAREVVTKVLRYFQEEGIVSVHRGRLKILSREKLRARL